MDLHVPEHPTLHVLVVDLKGEGEERDGEDGEDGGRRTEGGRREDENDQGRTRTRRRGTGRRTRTRRTRKRTGRVQNLIPMLASASLHPGAAG